MKLKWVAGLAACLALPALSLADTWQGYQLVSDNYFEGTGNAAHIVVVLPGNFNSCGWDNAGMIQLSVVGAEQYRALTELLLVAMSEGRTVSVATGGCSGNRANIIGLKLGNTG